MEVAVLQPYDCLKRHHHHHHRRQLISPVNKPRRNPTNVNVNPNPNANRSNRRRRNSPPPPPSSNGSTKVQQPRPKSPPVMGEVRILKRGEELSLPQPPPPPALPEPKVRSRSSPVLDGFYAGSAFVTSPSPSEVPLPAFFARRNCGFVSGGEAHNQEIASELRKVLKLI